MLDNWHMAASYKNSRGETKSMKNLGYLSSKEGDQGRGVFRNKKLEKLDSYYESRQYDNLPSWDQPHNNAGQYVPVRKRKPRLIFNFAKTLSQRVAAKLVGSEVFPEFTIADSPDDQEFFKAVIRESKLKSRILEPIRKMLSASSVFVRFYISGGAYKVEWFNSKVCYPIFQDNGQLESVTVKYIYEDEEDRDSNGKPKWKWWKMDFTTVSEIKYDNPEYDPKQEEPVFTEVARVDHELGFVQGEWFRTAEMPNSPDGYSLIEDIFDFIDDINYSLSQSSNAVSYNQDPQLALKGMTQEETENLIRSSTRSWNLGRDGEAAFIESNLSGVERAIELRDKMRLNIQDISRIVLMDPEKIVSQAQSGRALEIIHGPLVDLINELRPMVEDSLRSLILKMGIATVMAARMGIPVPIELPPGYAPSDMNLTAAWPPVFPQTTQDLQQKVSMVSGATSANLISRESGTRFIAKDFKIENVEEELQKIAAQPVINPFGGF